MQMGIYTHIAKSHDRNQHQLTAALQQHLRNPIQKIQQPTGKVRHTVSCYGEQSYCLLFKDPIAPNQKNKNTPQELMRSNLGFRKVRNRRCMACGDG
jgi:hypothetical protein